MCEVRMPGMGLLSAPFCRDMRYRIVLCDSIRPARQERHAAGYAGDELSIYPYIRAAWLERQAVRYLWEESFIYYLCIFWNTR